MKLCHDLVVLVADGTHMLLLRNQGDEVYPDLRVIEHRKFDNPPNREILSDAPGVGFSAAYPGRDTVARSDPHQLNEDRFLISAARALADVAEEAPAVMVVAPPHALGQLRQHYDDNIRARLVAEVDKDLVKHPVEEITRLLSA